MSTVPMELVSLLVPKEKAQEVAEKLVALGIFHPVDIRGIEDKLADLSSFQIDKENADFEALHSRVRDVSRKLKVDLGAKFENNIRDFSYAAAESLLESLDKEVAPLQEQIAQYQEQVSTDEMILTQVREYLPFSVRRNSYYSFLHVATGKIEEKNIAVLEKSLAGIPHVIYPFRKQANHVFAIFIGLRRDRALLDKVLRDVGWEEMEFPREADSVSQEAQDKLQNKIRETRIRISEIDSKIRALGDRHQEELYRINSAVRVHKSLLEAKRYSCITEKTALFSGWVPRDKKESLISQIKSASGVSYVESRDAESVGIPKEEVPVQFKHNSLLKPFELLVGAYGIPRYGSVDPTVFVAISFLIMFGAMFGDIGHGLVLVLLGLVLGGRSAGEMLKQVKALLLYCGCSSVIFGLLYGSFFGFEFESLWLKPIENIMEVFKISVFLGVAMISLGIFINIINSMRDRNYIKLLFDKSGLIGGLIYWAAIGLVVKTFVSKGKAPFFYSFLILSGMLVIFLYPIVDCVLRKKYSRIVESVMESVVGVLEIFMGYLANTVSFIRVAAFSLAHAGLFIAIFNLAAIVRSGTHNGELAPWLVIILGNILVIALEGMVVTIQSVRLNYYEFFSKFFLGGKRVYKPLTV